MDQERQQTALFTLSVLLEQQLEIVLQNQKMLTAMHDSLTSLLAEFAATHDSCLKLRADGRGTEQDRMLKGRDQDWVSWAKKTLLALRR